MPRNDQVSRQWHLLRRLEGSRGVTLRDLVDGLPEDFPKNSRTIRRDLEALSEVGFPLYTERRQWTDALEAHGGVPEHPGARLFRD